MLNIIEFRKSAPGSHGPRRQRPSEDVEAGIAELASCVAGLQSIAQLRRTYGHDEAQTLASCLSTKLVLLAGDGETAEWCEKELGRQEVIRPETSNSTSQRTGELPSSSENRSTRVVEQPAVLAGELLTLPNLAGFLKLVGLPIARVKLEYTPQPDNMPAFVAKAKD